MKIEIPTFYEVIYPEENYKYFDNQNHSDILKEKLLAASKNYCMYCKKKLEIQGEFDYNLEHSIEKSNGGDGSFLRNCKFNLSVSCSKCNQKFKAMMIQSIEIKDFNYDTCTNKNCSSPCEKINEAFIAYSKRNSIIVQPQGVINTDEEKRLEIEYDIIEEIFKESSKYKYMPRDANFILEHISRFALNKNRFNNSFVNISEEILENIKDELAYDRIFKKIKGRKITSEIEELFIDFLEKLCVDIQSLKIFCELVIILNSI